jgi:hypothetical protein
VLVEMVAKSGREYRLAVRLGNDEEDEDDQDSVDGIDGEEQEGSG